MRFTLPAMDIFYFFSGIILLTLSKIRNIFFGYRTPKPFSISEYERCINYDFQVVNDWLEYLNIYKSDMCSVAGKNILELGPGSDLGVGLYLLSLGALNYTGFDIFNLEKYTPDSFYSKFLERLKLNNQFAETTQLASHLKNYKNKKKSKLKYIVCHDYDIASKIPHSSIDLIFSQAAFEHLEDFRKVSAHLSIVSKPGAVLISQIDLRAHSRWIRNKDPNNIYRYSNTLYNILRIKGSPNRLRPIQYKNTLVDEGWTNVQIIPLTKMEIRDKMMMSYNKQFRDPKNQMNYLSIMLCATYS